MTILVDGMVQEENQTIEHIERISRGALYYV